MLTGSVHLKEEKRDRRGVLTEASIQYAGSFELMYTHKKGGSEECYAVIPGTQLSTRNYPTRMALQSALRDGKLIAK